MTVCPQCGKHFVRIHRSPVQKLVYSDIYRCHQCGFRTGRFRPSIGIKLAFIFSRYTRCVRCGTYAVERVSRRDRIDSVAKTPLSLIQRLLFAPLNKCYSCRLQYYDWRPLSPQARAK